MKLPTERNSPNLPELVDYFHVLLLTSARLPSVSEEDSPTKYQRVRSKQPPSSIEVTYHDVHLAPVTIVRLPRRPQLVRANTRIAYAR